MTGLTVLKVWALPLGIMSNQMIKVVFMQSGWWATLTLPWPGKHWCAHACILT